MLFSVLILAYTPKKILSFFAFLAYTRLYPKKKSFFYPKKSFSSLYPKKDFFFKLSFFGAYTPLYSKKILFSEISENSVGLYSPYTRKKS